MGQKPRFFTGNSAAHYHAKNFLLSWRDNVFFRPQDVVTGLKLLYDPAMLVKGFSKALFSTWFYLPEIRAVFDAGEGINFSLAGRLIKADAVFLTHGHTDHFAGLLNLLIARTRLGPADTSFEPVSVYYPAADANLRLYIDYVQRHLQTNGFPEIAHFQPVSPGQDVSLRTLRRHFARVFPVRHGHLPAVGYCIFETKDKVRPAYAHHSSAEIGHLIAQAGRPAILEPMDVPLVCYTGDVQEGVHAPCERPRMLIHESTFLSENDRAGSDHATLSEALDAARRIEPLELLLFHFSARYHPEEIRGTLRELLEASPMPSCQISYALPGRIFSTLPQEETG